MCLYVYACMYVNTRTSVGGGDGEVEDEDAAVVAADGEEMGQLGVEVQGHDTGLCGVGLNGWMDGCMDGGGRACNGELCV
jgi:hypothetical protein